MGSILTTLLYYPKMSSNFLTGFHEGVIFSCLWCYLIFLSFYLKTGPTFYNNIYITPWCRISAYAVGVLTGYCVIEASCVCRINGYVKFLISTFAIVIGLACIFTKYSDYTLPSSLDRSILVAYETLSRTLWSICIGWLLFLCTIKQGGIVNKILSWPIWSPLAKLNYSCYLVHYIVLLVMIHSQIVPLYYQVHTVVNKFVSYIFFSYVVAIFVSIFIETPFFILEEKLFKR